MSSTIYITFVEREGPYIKVWGQTDKNLPVTIEKSLKQVTPNYESGECMLPVESFQPGVLCCAKFKDGLYYRARINNITYINQSIIEVVFIDYGNKDFVPLMNIRTMGNMSACFLSIPPQASEFILAGVTHNGPTWDNTIFEMISNEIRYLNLEFHLIAQVGKYVLISLTHGDDLATSFITRGFAVAVPLHVQQMMLQSVSTMLMPAQLQPIMKSPIAAQPTLLTYKSLPLEIGTEHTVYISYVSEGPCLFSVQLQKMEEKLKQLMIEINSIQLQLLDESPLPGCVCLARSIDDDYICRAVVTSMVDGNFKVFYVDFGNTEVLPFTKLYQIPFKYVIPKVMATRFALNGLNNLVISLAMKCAFKEFVNNKALFMRVMPPMNGSALALCDLWDEKHVNALDFVKCQALQAYPDLVPLARGISQDIKVSFVNGCNKFYVQLKNKEEELNALMTKLQLLCGMNNPIEANTLQVGMPCNCLYEVDGMFYRAKILEINLPMVKVKYVDYGNEELVDSSYLRPGDVDLITILRPQAIECCLHGYQNMSDNEERDNLFEELILEKDFSMKVIEMHESKSLVDLFNEERINVASLLLMKMAEKKQGQVRTALVQDNHTVEYKKQPSPVYNNRRNENNEYTNNKNETWRDKRSHNNDSNDWRDNKSNRNQNQNNEGSDWRDNKKDNRNDNFSREDRPPRKYDNNNQNRPERSDRNSWDNNSPKNYDRKNDFKRKPRNEDFHNDKTDFNRNNNRKGDGSEKSWSGSEKNNRQRSRQSQERCSTPSWNNETVDLAPPNATFPVTDLNGLTENVCISWFHNPTNFYCQLESTKHEFENLMKQMQTTYKKRRPFDAQVGASVIALYPNDGGMYRATVLDKNPSAYNVFYVDFGNVSKTKCVYQIENKFINMPTQAHHCGIRDIAPIENAWPDSKSFSSYFEKDSFSCNFINAIDGVYQIDLSHNQADIREQLIRDGVAKDSMQIEVSQDVDLNILVGQQIRCVLSSVNNLKDILIQLQPELFVKCSMHNIDAATETWEENLINYLGHFVIIYIDNALENSLEITVYDAVGVKVQILIPDEGAFENIVPICSIPIICSELNGFVGHTTDCSVFIQPTLYKETIEQLMQHLQAHYEAAPSSEVNVFAEGIFAVHDSSTWIRGKVISIEEENITVVNIDVGNTLNVKINDIRDLDYDFLEYSMMAIEIFMENATSLMGQNISVTLTYSEDGWVGTLKTEPEKVTETVEVVEAEAIAAPEEAQIIPAEESGYQVGFSVELSHFDNPGQFYLQLVEASDAIMELLDKLQAEAPEFPVIESVTTGILCAAPYSVDQMWYRAQVLDADSDITTVRFVDYGNTDVLDATCNIKTLPQELLSMEHHAKRCSLYLKPLDGEWKTEACEKFEEMIATAKSLSAEIIHQDEKTSYVELYVDGVNICEVLLKENLAAELQLETSASCTGYVSNLNSPSEFWIQLESSCNDLEWIAEQLASAENYPQLEEYGPGSLCAAIFSDDGNWYRARILSNTVAGIEVLFIDYGNSCTCSSLRELPEDLIMLAPLAQKCSLLKPTGILQWPVNATDKFRDISADGITIFNVNILSQGETSVIQLLREGQDISLELKPETFDGVIKNYKTIDDFCVFRIDTDDKVQSMQEKLMDANNFPEVDDENTVIAAKCENGEWKRAKILTKNDEAVEVFLVDYGDIIKTEAVRKLDIDLSREEFLVMQCKLEPLPGYNWGEQSEQLFQDMLKNGETIFQIELAASNLVRLHLEGADIRSALQMVKCTPTGSLHSTPKKTSNLNKKTDDSPNILQSPIEERETYIKLNDTDITMLSVGEQDLLKADIVKEIVREITEGPPKQVEKIAQSLVEEIVHKSTKEFDLQADLENSNKVELNLKSDNTDYVKISGEKVIAEKSDDNNSEKPSKVIPFTGDIDNISDQEAIIDKTDSVEEVVTEIALVESSVEVETGLVEKVALVEGSVEIDTDLVKEVVTGIALDEGKLNEMSSVEELPKKITSNTATSTLLEEIKDEVPIEADPGVEVAMKAVLIEEISNKAILVEPLQKEMSSVEAITKETLSGEELIIKTVSVEATTEETDIIEKTVPIKEETISVELNDDSIEAISDAENACIENKSIEQIERNDSFGGEIIIGKVKEHVIEDENIFQDVEDEIITIDEEIITIEEDDSIAEDVKKDVDIRKDQILTNGDSSATKKEASA